MGNLVENCLKFNNVSAFEVSSNKARNPRFVNTTGIYRISRFPSSFFINIHAFEGVYHLPFLCMAENGRVLSN